MPTVWDVVFGTIVIVVLMEATRRLSGLPIVLLVLFFIVYGLAGAYFVGVSLMGLDPGVFISGLKSSIRFSDDIGGCFVKALIFGFLAGLIATFRGYNASPTAAGVSAATTSTVVVTSVAVLIGDYFVTALWGFRI